MFQKQQVPGRVGESMRYQGQREMGYWALHKCEHCSLCFSRSIIFFYLRTFHTASPFEILPATMARHGAGLSSLSDDNDPGSNKHNHSSPDAESGDVVDDNKPLFPPIKPPAANASYDELRMVRLMLQGPFIAC